MAQENYDYHWLDEGLAKRQASYSNIICYETGDPFRVSQLKAYLVSLKAYADAEIYYLNGWTGLCRISREKGTLEPVTHDVSRDYDQGNQNRVSHTRDSLLYLDGILKQKRAILILHDLDAHREESRDKDIIQALSDWAFHNEVFLTGSIIILMCQQASRVLDPVTMERVALIRPPLAHPEERARIINDQHEKLIGQADKNLVDVLVQATAGLNMHQLKTVLLESYQTSRTFSVEKVKELKSEFIKRSDLVEIEEPDAAGFNSIGGYQVVKNFVQNTIIRAIRQPERAGRFNVRIPRGVIFFGPPGTGKTLFAKALAREVFLPFINFRTENLFSEYLSVSGQRFRDAFRLIDQFGQAIVFIDEIDRLGQRRGEVSDGASEETRRVFNQILEWLGKRDRKAILIGTTNRPQDLDRAFRVGRIDYWIPFLYPNREARQNILAIHLGEAKMPGEVLAQIAELTDGYSGAEIEEVVNRANRLAFTGPHNSLLPEDKIQAYKAYRVNKEARRLEKEKFLKMAEEFTNDLGFLKELGSER